MVTNPRQSPRSSCPWRLRSLLFVGFAAFVISLSNASAIGRTLRTVIIDPGHGASQKGASHYGVYEKHLALDTSFRLERYLRSKGIKTVLTRRRDMELSLQERARIGNRYRDSIFVSIHYNSVWKSHIKGIETFYYGMAGKEVADRIHRSVMGKIDSANRGVKRNSFVVLTHSQNPACLVECGFLSNRWERERSMKGWYRQTMAEAIGRGILQYKADLRSGGVKYR